MKYIANICRILSGLVFVFSGTVKAIDPLGSAYKFDDYFQAFGMYNLEPVALPLALVLIILEFIVGFNLIFNTKTKLASLGALIFMIIFTPLTLYIALKNPVSDCGCFGDAWVISNWQTFYKNIFISLLVIVTFIYRKKFSPYFSPFTQWRIVLASILIVFAFSLYNIRHLPVIDFRPYKIGANLPEEMVIPEGVPHDEYKQMFTLKDKSTGEIIKIDSEVYMEDTTYWCAGTKWEFVETSEPILVKKGYVPPIHDFSITSLAGDDITDIVLDSEQYYFLVVAYNLDKSKTCNQEKVNELTQKCISEGYPVICLTATNNDKISAFKKKYNVPYDFCHTDPITLKTVVRANPGLVLLKKGNVIMKWHNNDLPSFDNLKEEYLK